MLLLPELLPADLRDSSADLRTLAFCGQYLVYLYAFNAREVNDCFSHILLCVLAEEML